MNLANEVQAFKADKESKNQPPRPGKLRRLLTKIFAYLVNGPLDKELYYHFAFGPETASLGEHGRIIGTWIKEGYRQEISISFFVYGYDRAPALDRMLFEELYAQAAMAGINMKHLSAYSDMVPLRTSVPAARASVPLKKDLQQ